MSRTERRVVLYASLAAAALVVAHSVLWDVARWNGHTFIADGDDLVTIGAAKAGVFRVSLLCDLFGSYLLTLPATLALWRVLRAHDRALVDLLALGGVIYAVAGAVAAGVFAESGAALIRSYAEAPATANATDFAILNQGAVATWQVVCVFVGGLWWLGSGWLLRDRWKWFARYSVTFGALGLVLWALKVAGVQFESSGPATVAFLPTAVWIGWLGVSLAGAADA